MQELKIIINYIFYSSVERERKEVREVLRERENVCSDKRELRVERERKESQRQYIFSSRYI
jgi:hypothetical protein